MPVEVAFVSAELFEQLRSLFAWRLRLRPALAVLRRLLFAWRPPTQRPAAGLPESVPFGEGGGLIGGTYYDEKIIDCFWDVETSGRTSSDGGIGLPTEDMQKMVTFTDYGWDFVGEDINGTNDIWRMCADGIDYPHLS